MGDSFVRFWSSLKYSWITAVGFALFCVMLRQPYFGSILSESLSSVHSIRGILDGSIVVLAIVALLVGKFKGALKQVTGLPVAAGLLSMLGVFMLAAAITVGWNPKLVSFAGAFSCAIGFVLLAALWMQKLAFVPRESLLPLALLSFTVSLFLGVVDIANGFVKTLANALIPACSALCAFFAPGSIEPIQKQGSDDFSAHVLKLAIVLMIVEILCCSLIRGTWNTGGVGYGGVSFQKLVSYSVSVAFGAALFVLTLVVKQHEKSIALISAISLVATIVLIAVMAIADRTVVGPYTTSLYSVLLVVLFAALSGEVQRENISHFASAGLFCLVFACISLVAYTLVPYTFSYDGARGAELVLPVSLAAALVVAIGVCIVVAMRLRAQVVALKEALGDSAHSSVWDGLALLPVVFENPVYISSEEALDTSVQKATELYRLTTREAEIVKLFAQGRTIKQTAGELHLAASTVQGYTKSIYAKLGVHGKDEIRDLLQNISEE